ncbi:hypothetical protein C2G38_2155698 [Gigaspora rosea]|uniref:Uncharacterized protein n=1 Tax=Gigaspora rosea TaxID=44941 RepID=A0A397W5I4_9GLOM|nr:hypothetical protein C2G38_2155698 [Gigaspora rosea]
MLHVCECTDITPYPKSKNKKEFWSQSKVPTIDKANLKLLYDLGYLQISLYAIELAYKHSQLYGPAFIQNKNNVAQNFYKTDAKTRVPVLYMQDQKEALWTKFQMEYVELLL